MNWAGLAKGLVSIISMGLFGACLTIAYFGHDQTNMPLLMGAAISMATGVVNYWLGSSAGSERKTELMSANPAPSPPTPVVTPPTV